MNQNDRTSFLKNIKTALQQSKNAKTTLPELSEYDISRLVTQNASDLLERFAQHAADEGMIIHRFTDRKTLTAHLIKLCLNKKLHQLIVADDLQIKALGVIEVIQNHPLLNLMNWRHRPDAWFPAAFSADASIAAAAYALAENGALALTTGPAQPRLLHLAPPVHICLVTADRLHADLLDLLHPQNLSSSFTLVAGPSKTSDIEMKLVTGVHGPIEEHIFILE